MEIDNRTGGQEEDAGWKMSGWSIEEKLIVFTLRTQQRIVVWLKEMAMTVVNYLAVVVGKASATLFLISRDQIFFVFEADTSGAIWAIRTTMMGASFQPSVTSGCLFRSLPFQALIAQAVFLFLHSKNRLRRHIHHHRCIPTSVPFDPSMTRRTLSVSTSFSG
jgi:hypothetical protein